MNNTPDYENNLAFAPKDTNYDILKEYEAHGEPLPSYEDWQLTKKRSWLVPEFDNEIDELNDTIEELEKENKQLKKWCEEFNALEVAKENDKLKDLLKECKKWMSIERDFAMPNEKIILQMTLDKIDEVLK